MYVVHVIPIARNAFTDELSFFSKTLLTPGVVVDVPIRGKTTPALVITVNDVRSEKLTLRESSFALKKLEPKRIRALFPPHLIEACRTIAEYHVVPLGTVLAYFTPRVAKEYETPNSAAPGTHAQAHHTVSEIVALQAEYEERVRMYRNVAREAFARGGSVIIVTPTIVEAEALYEKLHRGIDEQVVLLTSASTKKALQLAWEKVVSQSEPVLMLATPSFLAIPRSDVHTIVVERESARSYRTRERPFLDTRVAAEHIARASSARLIYADFPLRIETRARLESGEFEELMRLQVSSQHRTRVHVVDARKKSDASLPEKKQPFTVFTEETLRAINNELSQNGRVFVYAARRGLAPLTVCNDCGTPVTDPTNKTPMTLHKTEKGNVFVSFYSGALMKANISCASCGSWNLTSLGIGVERVFEEVQKYFGKHPAFLVSVDTADTHAKAKKITGEFFNTPGAVLVGTERALPYLTEPVELSVVASIDSLLSLSAWRAHEYALSSLFFLRDRTERLLIIQTRQTDHEVIRASASGNPTEFIRRELADRASFSYPPSATFVGLTWTGTEHGVNHIGAEITKHLAGWDVVGPLPARFIGKNRYRARAVVRLTRTSGDTKNPWPHRRLIEALKHLPPGIAVTIDPDEIV